MVSIPQREVGGQHGRRKTLRRVEGVWHSTGSRVTLGLPLVRTGRALCQLPFVAEQVVKEAVAPLRWRTGPDNFQAAADRVTAFACAKTALPAKALLLYAGILWLSTHQCRIPGTVGFAEGVTAGDERNRLFIVHRHAKEGLTDIPRCSDRIRLAVGTFRIDVNQTHLHGSERIFEIAVSGVAFVAQPGAFRAPIDVFFRLPDVLTPASETEGLESHRLQSDISGKNHQVGPGEFPPVLLLYRPEQAARLVEVDVVRPTVQWSKALGAVPCTAAAVANAVRAGAVPGHANEQRSVVAEVRRPPVLRIRHQCVEVLDDGIQVKALELLGVIELLVHGIGL